MGRAKKKVYRPTRDILDKVAKGILKRVKLDCVEVVQDTSQFFPLRVRLPAPIDKVCTHFSIRCHDGGEDDNGGGGDDEVFMLALTPTSAVQIGGYSGCRRRPYMSLADFMDVTRSVDKVARDIKEDSQLIAAAQRCCQQQQTGNNMHMAVLAELYLMQNRLLYAYFITTMCGGGQRRRWYDGDGVTIETKDGGQNTTETTIRVRKDCLCNVCCAVLLSMTAGIDVTIEPKMTITLVCKSTNLDNEQLIAAQKQHMLENM